jgi:glycosyltransferase involved in cell wall biosynthesis
MVTGQAGDHVTQEAHQHGIDKNLFLTGFVPIEELSWFMGCADMFVLPFPETVYNVGRWPNKLGDYLSIGRPILSNPVGDVKTLFENSEIGFLTGFSKEEFAEKMIDVIENPDIASSYGKNARRLATDVLDWKINIKKLEDFYFQILKSSCS